MKKLIFCPFCHSRHVDKNVEIHPVDNGVIDTSRKVNFARKPHKRHTCEKCGKTFEDTEKSIGI